MRVGRAAALAAVVSVMGSFGLGLGDAWGATPRVVMKVVTPSILRGSTLVVTLAPGVDHCTLSVPHLTPLAKTKVVVAHARKASLTVPEATTLGKHDAVMRCRQGLARSTFKVIEKVGAGGALTGIAPSPTPTPSASPTPSPAPTTAAPTTAAPTTAAPTPAAPTTSASPSPTQSWAETVGGETHTFTDYTDAGGDQGKSIPLYTTVQISCRIEGFVVSDGNAWWYRIASSPWSDEFYASADAFYNNGAVSGGLAGTPLVDRAVALCPTPSG